MPTERTEDMSVGELVCLYIVLVVDYEHGVDTSAIFTALYI